MKDDKAPFSSFPRDPSCFENRNLGFVSTLEGGPARRPMLLILGRLREMPGASASSCTEPELCRPNSSVFDRLACDGSESKEKLVQALSAWKAAYLDLANHDPACFAARTSLTGQSSAVNER